MRCKFCYNSQFVLLQKIKELHTHISEEDFFSYLLERKNFLEWVVICWGEPTVHHDLPAFIEKIKKMWYFVKLDTNWSNPHIVKHLLENKLIDYIAMDIKDSFDSMTELTQSHIDLQEAIKESIALISKSTIDYEFRTTITKPYHTKEKIAAIASYLQWKKKYYLQNFFPTSTMIDTTFVAASFTHNELLSLQEMASQYIPTYIRE